jgi:hypothetical protein
MKNKADSIIEAAKMRNNKGRFTFTLSPAVKEALAKWCKVEKAKESAVIEALLKATIPQRYFKD